MSYFKLTDDERKALRMRIPHCYGCDPEFFDKLIYKGDITYRCKSCKRDQKINEILK